MEYKSREMIKIINKTIEVLKLSDGPIAKYYCDFLLYTLDQLNKPHELHKIAENVLKIYGGAGSFNDLAIFINGECLIKESSEFVRLSGILYEQCKEAILETRE